MTDIITIVNKKIILWTLCLAGVLLPVFPQSLDEAELKKTSFDTIRFTNYQGPHAYLNTREEILGIGRSLAAGVAGAPRFALGNKYAVVRVYEPQDPRLSADIIALLPEAGVDHIRNLNLIVAGYLEQSLKYPLDTALLLADFITRYNAFYRGNVEYVASLYSPGVSKEVTAENLGLDTVFSQWAGRSRILIPLSSTVARGDRGLVNADVISTPEVTAALKEEPAGLEQMKELTNLKEEEIVQEQQAIAKAEEALDRKEADIILRMEEGQKEPAAAPEAASGAPEGTPAQESASQDPPAPEKLGTETSPASDLAEIQRERQALEEKKEQVAQREEALQESRQEIAQAENKKLEEAKQAPATAPAAAAPAAAPAAPVDSLVFLTITDSEGQFSQLVQLDRTSGKVLRRSALNTIRGRQTVPLGTSLVVIAGRTEGSGTVRLASLSADTLQTVAEGKDDMSPFSRLLVSGSQFYAVYKDKAGLWKAGLFNGQLVLVAGSEEEVLPGTLMELKGSQLILQGKNGAIIRLNDKTLKKEGDFRG